MSDAISLELPGSITRSLQADVRALRTRLDLMETRIGNLITRDEAREMLRAALQHMSTFEAQIETRFDALNGRFDALETLLRSKR